ncbi:MAG: aspartate aminotransferase family protein [Thermodesulfobacteriota bacterium]
MGLYENHEIARAIVARYREKTKKSHQHLALAREYLPGGDTRRVSFYPPYPAFMERGQGCRIWDVDGNEYLDFQNNYTSLIHGHAHPQVTQAAYEQLKKGVVLGSATEIQYRHAQHLCGRIPALEMLRYTNSGTEATMFALRTARAFTGRPDIVKMDGGYHGGHEFAQVNIFPDLEAPGGPRAYAAPYVPPGVVGHVQVLPFNDLTAAQEVLPAHQDRIAAVLMEPCLGAGGGVGPRPGYLAGMRELTRRYGVLLIFDEIMMFRVHAGGMQALEGVEPDLTALGKIIGGGFPVGAFGGRRDIMKLYDPADPRAIFHSGTFTGNSVTLAAGLTTLELYDQKEVDRLNALGDRMRAGFRTVLDQAGVIGLPSGLGSLVMIHWRDDLPVNSREAIGGFLKAGELPGLVHLEMMNQGIHSAPRGLFAMSTPMGEKEIDETISVFDRTMQTLKPYIADVLPHLVRS